MSLFLKEFEDSAGGVTGSEHICEGILCQVYPNLVGIVIKVIKDELKTRRDMASVGDILLRMKEQSMLASLTSRIEELHPSCHIVVHSGKRERVAGKVGRTGWKTTFYQ